MLTSCIAQLDDIYAVSPTPDIYKKHLTMQAECDTLLTDQVTELLVKSRSTYYEQGDKACKFIAHVNYHHHTRFLKCVHCLGYH